jgi:hypothetical protein
MSKSKKNIVVTAVEQVITVATEAKRRGRPVNPTSERQQRLALMAERREAGEVKRGRPMNPNSARQLKLQSKGTGKRGRPVNPHSVRQLKLTAKVLDEMAAHVGAAK